MFAVAPLMAASGVRSLWLAVLRISVRCIFMSSSGVLLSLAAAGRCLSVLLSMLAGVRLVGGFLLLSWVFPSVCSCADPLDLLPQVGDPHGPPVIIQSLHVALSSFQSSAFGQ